MFQGLRGERVLLAPHMIEALEPELNEQRYTVIRCESTYHRMKE